jgi:CRISPR-associated protein Csd2
MEKTTMTNFTGKVFNDPTRLHEAVMLIDCTDGNPNGDPSMGNQPRIDLETGHGLMTDACLKRKIRDYIYLRGQDINPEFYNIFIQEGSVLNDAIASAYERLKVKPKGKAGSPEQQLEVQRAMKEMFFDIRMFGAVLSTGLKAGQVWGPVQVSHARSIDPVDLVTHQLTRCAATKKEDKKEDANGDGDEKETDNKTFGWKHSIAYGLFKFAITYNPNRGSEFISEQDLALFWESLLNLWSLNRSSARGMMAPRGLWIISHANKYGSGVIKSPFDRLTAITKKEHPRRFSDYDVSFDDTLEEDVDAVISRLI